jgi:hypothetical protein
MDAKVFRDEVMRQALPSVSRALLGMVSQAWADVGACERRDIATCIQLAAQLQSAGLEVPQDGMQQPSVPMRAAVAPTPEMRLRSAQLTYQIEASVQAVRQTLFGQPSAPFPSLSEAIQWIEGEVRQLYDGIAEWARALYQPLWDHAFEPSPLAGEPGTPETSQRLAVLLEAVRAGMIGWVAPAEHGSLQGGGRHGFVDTPVCQLQRYVRQLARASGFSPPDLAAYMLAAIPPILDAATISVEHLTVPIPFGGGEIQRSQVTLTVHARDLSYHEHRDLFRQVRQELNLVRAKGLTDEDIELRELVDSLGSPPRGRGAGPYWTRVQRAWNRHHPKEGFETPDGPRMWYRRLQQKLKDLGLDGPRGAHLALLRQKPRRSKKR